MILAELNAETDMAARHDVQRSAHLMIAIDTLTECWNGLHDKPTFIDALRRTAQRITGLADALENPDKPTQ